MRSYDAMKKGICYEEKGLREENNPSAEKVNSGGSRLDPSSPATARPEHGREGREASGLRRGWPDLALGGVAEAEADGSEAAVAQ